MKHTLKTATVLTAIAVLLVMFALTGCSNTPNEEELKALEEAKAAALAAEDAQAKCESEKSDLESTLADKKQTLNEMQEEKEVVTERLEEM